jgi:hypothetical protein
VAFSALGDFMRHSKRGRHRTLSENPNVLSIDPMRIAREFPDSPVWDLVDGCMTTMLHHY